MTNMLFSQTGDDKPKDLHIIVRNVINNVKETISNNYPICEIVGTLKTSTILAVNPEIEEFDQVKIILINYRDKVYRLKIHNFHKVKNVNWLTYRFDACTIDLYGNVVHLPKNQTKLQPFNKNKHKRHNK